jgi:hypothetical protein
MFGTLVICLPSEHTGGGTVRLKYREDSMTLPFERPSVFDCTYVAWFADVTHQVSFALATILIHVTLATQDVLLTTALL